MNISLCLEPVKRRIAREVQCIRVGTYECRAIHKHKLSRKYLSSSVSTINLHQSIPGGTYRHARAIDKAGSLGTQETNDICNFDGLSTPSNRRCFNNRRDVLTHQFLRRISSKIRFNDTRTNCIDSDSVSCIFYSSDFCETGNGVFGCDVL